MPKTLYACTLDPLDLERHFDDYDQVVADSLAAAAVSALEQGGLPAVGGVCFVRSLLGQWYQITIKGITIKDGHSRIHFGIETIGKVQDMAKMGCMLPCPADRCQECGADHKPEEPHNKDSLRYQYAFYRKHDRWPNWWDALEHCTDQVREAWLAELKNQGVDQAQLEVSVG